MMKLSTLKRNWMLHYIKPEYLYLPRISEEEPEPIPTSWDYRIKIDFLFTEEKENEYSIPNEIKAKPVFCLKSKNNFIFFELYKQENKTIFINGVYKTWAFLFFNPIKYKNRDIAQNIAPTNIDYTLTLSRNSVQSYIFCFDKKYDIELYDLKADYAKIHENAISFNELTKVDSSSRQQNMENTSIIYYPAYCDITLNDIFEVKRPPNTYSIETVTGPQTEVDLGFVESSPFLSDGFGNVVLFTEANVRESIWRNNKDDYPDGKCSYYFKNLGYKNNMNITTEKLKIDITQILNETTYQDLKYSIETSLDNTKFGYAENPQQQGSPLYAEDSWDEFDGASSFYLSEAEDGKQKTIGYQNRRITEGYYSEMSASSFAFVLKNQSVSIPNNYLLSLYRHSITDNRESRSLIIGDGVTLILPQNLAPGITGDSNIYHHFPRIPLYPEGSRWPRHGEEWTPVGPQYPDHNPRPYDPYVGELENSPAGMSFNVYYEQLILPNMILDKKNFNNNTLISKTTSHEKTLAYYSGTSVSVSGSLFETTATYLYPADYKAYKATKINIGANLPTLDYAEWHYNTRGSYTEETRHNTFSGGFLYPSYNLRLYLIELFHSSYNNYNEKNNTIIFNTPSSVYNMYPYINKIYYTGAIDTFLNSKTMYDTDEVIFRHFVNTERNSLRLQDFL